MGTAPQDPMQFLITAQSLCFPVQNSSNFCIAMPGGAEICAIVGLAEGDIAAAVRAFIQQINTALAPLAPIFNILDLAVAVVECVKAVPDCIAIPPQPQKLFDCIPGLLEALEKLLALLPPLTIPRMVKGILLAVVAMLNGLKIELQSFIRAETDILAAATLAAKPGNVKLLSAVDCARANFDAQLANMNAGMAPLNRLVGYVNLLLSLALIDQQVPTFDQLGDDAAAMLEAIDPIVHGLQIIADAIPVPA